MKQKVEEDEKFEDGCAEDDLVCCMVSYVVPHKTNFGISDKTTLPTPFKEAAADEKWASDLDHEFDALIFRGT